MSSLEKLAQFMMKGEPSSGSGPEVDEAVKSAIDEIFGQRYQAKSKYSRRVVRMAGDDGISFSGLVHQDSPSSGVYGGMSLIWFPRPPEEKDDAGSLLTLVCGTRGLSPDEAILGRPGHVRHLRALQRYLREVHAVESWSKYDPTDLNSPFPKVVQKDLNRFDNVFKKYGTHIYFAIPIPQNIVQATNALTALLDLYAWERGWIPLKAFEEGITEFRLSLRARLFPSIDENDVFALLKQRRFVILQGPPGTGKSRMAERILKRQFSENGSSIQFHPAVSYESFVSGISPRVDSGELSFHVRSGSLTRAVLECRESGKDYLLHIDEINRADLSRVLGEAIYLLEPREISQGQSRSVMLPNAESSGDRSLSIPDSFYILGTMNSADRSIAIMDLAVRRRFAFVDVWPSMNVIREQGLELASESFARLQDIFVEYAADEAFSLLPGHSYFLAESEDELKLRLRYELIPLLNEYILEGRLSSCETELRAYIDWLGSRV